MRNDPDNRIPVLSDVAETIVGGTIDAVSDLIGGFFPSGGSSDSSSDEEDDD